MPTGGGKSTVSITITLFSGITYCNIPINSLQMKDQVDSLKANGIA
jgi:superfamily II DNA helicase RecQ